jgi:hypothetical protein
MCKLSTDHVGSLRGRSGCCTALVVYRRRSRDDDRRDGYRKGTVRSLRIAGLHVLTNRTAVERSGDRYAIATDLDSRGLASMLSIRQAILRSADDWEVMRHGLKRTAQMFVETAWSGITQSISNVTAL